MQGKGRGRPVTFRGAGYIQPLMGNKGAGASRTWTQGIKPKPQQHKTGRTPKFDGPSPCTSKQAPGTQHWDYLSGHEEGRTMKQARVSRPLVSNLKKNCRRHFRSKKENTALNRGNISKPFKQ